MRRFFAVAAGLLVIGCTTPTYHPMNRFVGIRRGSIESFSALVPGSSGAATCETPPTDLAPPGGRAVSLVYDGPVRQQITVLLDAAGTPTAYVDARGDLSDPEQADGDRTTIGLYLREDYAVLSNRPRGTQATMLEVPLVEAYASDRLGNPSAQLQQVLEACGTDI
jgi:hypothetical protein